MSDSEVADLGKSDGDLTILLQAYARGDQRAWHSLIDRVYSELRLIAAGQLRAETVQDLMQPTALINEAYLRLVSGDEAVKWINRRHFFAAASETMRRILVDQARRRLALKRGGGANPLDVNEVAITFDMPDDELIDIDTALQEFAAAEPDKAELVKLRFYVGMSEQQAAETLGISRPTASRHWTYARAWLFDRLKRQVPDSAVHLEKMKKQ